MSRTSFNSSQQSPAEQSVNRPFSASPRNSFRKNSYTNNVPIIGNSLSLPDKLELLDSVRNNRRSSTDNSTPEMTPAFGSPAESPRINKNSFTPTIPRTSTGPLSSGGSLVSIEEGTMDESIHGSTMNQATADVTVSHPPSSEKPRRSNSRLNSIEGRASLFSRVNKILDQNEFLLENPEDATEQSSLDSQLTAAAIVKEKPRPSSSASPLIDRFSQPSVIPVTPSSSPPSSSTSSPRSSSSSVAMVGGDDSTTQVSYPDRLELSFPIPR